MSEFYQMYTVLNREDLPTFQKFYESFGVNVTMISLAYGTALPITLEYWGLTGHEKVIITAIVTRATWKPLKKALLDEMRMNDPGHGVAFIVPLASVGRRSQLMFLSGGQEIGFKEEATLKETRYELLVAVGNMGYNETIMEAARAAGAGGGTVVHARGTGMEGAEKFFGVSLAKEKEIIYIVVKSETKAAIMESIMKNCGPETPAQAIVFSLPVSSVCGIRFDKPSETVDEKLSEAIDNV